MKKLLYKFFCFQLKSTILLAIFWMLTASPLMAQNKKSTLICSDVITYGQDPNTNIWSAFPTPCDVPDGWKSEPVKPSSPTGECVKVITYAQNPETENWYTFLTPCDVPSGWNSSPLKPEEKACPEQVTYGQNPNTQDWYVFSTPCDVPLGWISSSTKPDNTMICSDVTIYGKNPTTEQWYLFATPCDVPLGWFSLPQLPDNASEAFSCSNFYATYSQDGKLHIPRVVYTMPDGGTTKILKQLNLKHDTTFINPVVFILSLDELEKQN
jgi:uncharacterized protein YbdZ (MbtH family)